MTEGATLSARVLLRGLVVGPDVWAEVLGEGDRERDVVVHRSMYK